jgi:hypothetical protein
VTVALVGHVALTRDDFRVLYGCQIGLAVLTALLCAPVDTRPRR